MKYLMSSILLSLVIGSCSKENCLENPKTNCQEYNAARSDAENTLFGTWKLVQIKNKYSGAIITNSTPDQGEVIITFKNSSAKTLNGTSPRNTFWGNYVVSDSSKMIFDITTTTKAGENEWGRQFNLNGIEETTRFYFSGPNNLILQGSVSSMTFVRL